MTRLSFSLPRIDPENNKNVQDISDVPNSTVTCFGYRTNTLKTVIYYVLNVCLVGAPYLICRWCLQWKVYLTLSPTFLRHATMVLIKDEDEHVLCHVRTDVVDFLPDKFIQLSNVVESTRYQETEEASERTPLRAGDELVGKSIFRHFNFRHENYFWDEGKNGFRKLEGLEEITAADLQESFQGWSMAGRRELHRIYGPNLINVEVKPYGKLLFDEVLNPFYVFQIFSVALWCVDDYYYYAVCVIVISIISITTSLVETRRQMECLREMAIGQENLVIAVRTPQGGEETIFAHELVPGDVILVPPEGFIMPCDAVVTAGSCIVNESMLTGESIPVRKTPIATSNESYNLEVHKRHTVFAGTQVIQTRFYGGNKISCVVVRTGFTTLKGGLIRSMLFPKENGLDFFQDAMRFVLGLFLIALCGMSYCAYLYIERHASFYVLIIRILDIVTIVVPPALPAALTVGTVYAQTRLKRRGIFCISPPKINLCGKLQLICFDKTGTLTEDGLDFASVVPTEGGGVSSVTFLEPLYEIRSLPNTSQLARCLATCHSLTYIKGKLVGDPLDMKMFDATGWTLVEPLDNADEQRFDLLTPTFVKMDNIEAGIIREFEFTPQLQRMSVVVKALDSPSMSLYCKGSPEKVSSLCSKLPEDYDLVLDSYTVKGYRVLALGRKDIVGLHWHQVQRVPREMIEKDMVFVGFLIMQNSLKPATMPVIRELKNADLRSIMVTGDNALTALSVARECGMIPTCDKVVIVNALEDGEIEFTLAAHHYEAEDSIMHEAISPSRSRRMSRVTSKSRSSSSECPPSFLGSQGSRDGCTSESALEDDDDDSRIDMDRLIPIGNGGVTLSPSFITMKSNYHFVVSGKSWDVLYRCHPAATLYRILAKGTVYARMSPEWKQQLIESLQDMGYVTGMCGDGANDCSALKTAHVGISLSEAEASVAAPFTSKIPDISCVPHLIREGRCALVTSFGTFKYMALYSLIQFITVLLLYRLGSNLADTEFLYIDLVITTTLAIAMGRTDPYHKIVSKRPVGNLWSLQNMISILSQIVITALIQIASLEYLQVQPWYQEVRITTGDEMDTFCWENTTLFCVSAYQYLILALVFSKGPPFRKPFYTNGYFVLCLGALTGVTTVLTVYPFSFLGSFMDLMPLDPLTTPFRYSLLVFPFLNLIISLTIETLLSISASLKNVFGIRSFKKSKHKYQEILQEIENDATWPQVKCP